MGLTEKTLEINVTHELLNQADYLWYELWRAASQRGRQAAMPTMPSPYASGLSLRAEAGLGYDIRLERPAGFAGVPHVVFMQFKLGSYRNRARAGIFRWRPNLVFGINNNTKHNQHAALKAVAARTGHPGAAVYVLPLFRDEADLRGSLGGLLPKTAFKTALAIDAAASSPIIGEEHKIAIQYRDAGVWELRSVPTRAEGDSGPDFFAEIVAIRYYRALLQWREVLTRRGSALTAEDAQAIRRNVTARLAAYLGLSVQFIIESLPEATTEDRSFWKELDLSRRPLERTAGPHDEEGLGRRRAMFSSVIARTRQFWDVLRTTDWSDLIEPSPILTAPLPEEGFRMQWQAEGYQEYTSPARIWYQLF